MTKSFRITLLGLVLCLGFLVRLYKINNPIADWHSWRQADTSAVTRNFFKHGIDLLHPKYDDFSDVSSKGLINYQGYRFVEFPIFNLIHYVFALLFPVKPLEFWGRMVSILASLVSSIILYKLVRKHYSYFTGLMAMFFFLFIPFNIYFSRVVLPDPLMVTFFLSALYFFDEWSTHPKISTLTLSIIFGSMAILVKPMAIFFLLPATWQFWRKYKYKLFKTPLFYLFHLLILGPFVLWRIWSYNFPQGIPSSAWLLNGNHIRFKGAFFQWIFGERLGAIILGKWGLFPLLGGFIVANAYFLSWVFGAIAYLTIFATGNVQHDYYQIPIIPIVSVLLALGTNYFYRQVKSRLIVIISVLFCFAFSWYTVRGNYQVNHWEIVHAGEAVNKLTPPDAVVIAPWGGDTAFLYQTNRQGFPFMIMPVKDLIDRFGAGYYVSVNFDDQTNAIMSKYTVVDKTSEYVLVKLVEPR